MSLKAGGVGLNLTAASNVFLMVVLLISSHFVHCSFPTMIFLNDIQSLLFIYMQDPWWNPAVEEQAIMRIHRIGQKRTVLVRRFIVKVRLSNLKSD